MRSKTDMTLTLALIILLLGLVGGANAQGGDSAEAPALIQTALGTAFTYQGKISNNGGLVNGNCDMAFRLYDDASTGNQIGSAITTTVPVTNSRFTVALDFGSGVFAGQARWLELRADCGGGYVTLNPRQAITAAPEALHAQTADSVAWEGLTGKPQPFYPLYRPQTLDLTTTDADLKGFIGGFTDGRYGYFVPNDNSTPFGKVARVDLQNFTSGGVTILDLTTIDPNLKGFVGGFTDGHYGYFVPLDNGAPFGKVARVDLQNFTSSGVTVLDLTTVDANLKGFRGGFTDGHYSYFVPNDNGVPFGKVARVDLQNFTAGGVTVLDLTTIDANLKGFRGGFTDGRFGYLVPYNNGAPFGKVARVDLQNFTSGGVTILDLTTIDPNLKGFVGGFTDGYYGYFVPYNNGAHFGKVARVDLQNFTSGGVTVLDLTIIDPNLKGFRGGFTDGRYGYLVPSNNGMPFGTVARIQLFFGGGSP